MVKRRIFQGLAWLAVGVLFGCPGVTEAAAETKKAEYVIKTATLAPEGTVWMKTMRAVSDHVQEASGGALFTKFYSGGVMGDEPDVVRKMKLGQLDGSGVSLTGVRLTCPEFQVLEMPFLFGGDGTDSARAYQEAEYVMLKLYNEFDQYAEKQGYRIIAIASAGFAHICSANPLDNMLRDLPQQKVWQWEGETVMKAISESLGVPTISLPLPETLTALQTGMINAFYGTPIHVLAFQWNKYITHIYSPPIFYTPSYVVVSERAWNKIPENIRNLFFDEKATRIKLEALKWIHDDDRNSLEVLKKQGVKVVAIPPDQLREMKERTRKVWKEMSGKIFPADLLDKVERLLEAYRAEQGGAKATP
jgi:TRAP-type C4-dicarboxylate transport system substrate-binding protein